MVQTTELLIAVKPRISTTDLKYLPSVFPWKPFSRSYSLKRCQDLHRPRAAGDWPRIVATWVVTLGSQVRIRLAGSGALDNLNKICQSLLLHGVSEMLTTAVFRSLVDT